MHPEKRVQPGAVAVTHVARDGLQRNSARQVARLDAKALFNVLGDGVAPAVVVPPQAAVLVAAYANWFPRR